MIDYTTDLPRDLCIAAFSGTSFTPERRADTYQSDYSATLNADHETMRAHAEKGGTLDLLGSEFARYREGYGKRYRAWLSAHSRCLSTMITGPANFPVRRAERANACERGRLNDLIGFRERAIRSAISTLRPDLRPIMAGDSDACERLAADIAKAERNQQIMKDCNAAIRKHSKAGQDAQISALITLGLSEQNAIEALKPDFCGRIGFQGYALSNNSANIRRMKERLAAISKAKETPASEIQGDGVKIEDCPADNRVRLFFDGKPDADIRARLKSNGFRWSPTIGAWQAYRNERAMNVARSFVQKVAI